ncbi:CinA family protein, partial [Balneolaceae bacterium ANBcel3]|nr:CinA family protein [Balneolaceae bacterium ANBcel3]
TGHVREFMYSDQHGETLFEVVLSLLQKRNKKLAVAESCTGGYLSNVFTDIPGSSATFLGSFIAYDNAFKSDVLKVDEENIEGHGAVSARIALDMAANAGMKTGADYALSTTGIAGPSGGTEEKPVGTVWIGLWSRDGAHMACRFQLTTERLVNKERSAFIAADMLRRVLLGLPAAPLRAEIVNT